LIDYSARDGIAIITLNRPPANAFSSDMYRELTELSIRIATDERVRVAILTTAGERIFSGGADVKELATLNAEGRQAFFNISSEARRAFAAVCVVEVGAREAGGQLGT
jgi:enoyl-CoA hydratase